MKKRRWIVTVLILGYAFLYAPILSLVVYSFNASQQVMVWGGFSTKWYGCYNSGDYGGAYSH